MAGPQRKRKVKRRRFTHAEALRQQRKKPPDGVHSQISNWNSEPLVHQVVMKLQEICRAVIATNVNMIMSEAVQSKVEQVSKECTSPLVESSVVSKEKTDMTCSEISYASDQVNVANSDIFCSKICGSPASLDVLDSVHADGADSLVKLEICETESWKSQQNNLNCVSYPKNTHLHDVIKEECECDVNDSNICASNVINETFSLKTEPVDSLANVSHKIEQQDRKSVDLVENSEGPSSSVAGDDILLKEQESLSNQPFDNKTFSNNVNKIVLHDYSRSENQYCKENGCNFTGPMNVANRFENSPIVAANENTSFSGTAYSLDESRGNCLMEIQKHLGLHSRIRERRFISHSLTSASTEESLDSLLSNEMGERECSPDLKNYHLKDEILYNTRNCGMVGDADRLSHQEVSDSGSIRFSADSRYALSSISMGLSNDDSCRDDTSAHSWSSTSLSINSGGRIDSYLEPNTDIPHHYSFEASDSSSGFYTERLCEDVHMLQRTVPVTYPAMSISPPAMLPQEGIVPGTKTLKSCEEELLRRIEESLTERETLKYQKEELFNKIEKSLTETESLKYREEELLKKIERSLTEAKSMKFREEELLRRIEVSLAQRETVKPDNEDLFIRLKTSLKDATYNSIDLQSTDAIEFESEHEPDLDKSLPLKKRKKLLKTLTDDEDRTMQIRNLSLESFPSFPSWPMISIAQLEAIGKLQHNLNFPSFPSQPMISIAEFEAHTACSKSHHHTFESSKVVPWVSRCPHYCNESSFCDESPFSRDVSVGGMYEEFLEHR
ncbi:uncharacterized protein LOC110839056 isoform X2 [Zootermopsis nevadensis]|uniref:uncharacterized protein LOC110839056 isoform X2 n=1 Tax=Zootermopsis nevadensis TaxID=136037 RepID=UPI000B8E7014|nr:uncharacterized protein LOC110839056 isoform X2 [Zootermopsis nevadensis]